MDQYIIVKVRDATGRNGRKFTSNLGMIRKAIHSASEECGISIADMVTHTSYMDNVDSKTIDSIFERTMKHVKQLHEEWKNSK